MTVPSRRNTQPSRTSPTPAPKGLLAAVTRPTPVAAAPKIAPATQKHGSGEVSQTFTYRIRAWRWWETPVFAIGVLSALMCWIYGLALRNYDYRNYGAAAIGDKGQLWLNAGGLIFLATMFFLVLRLHTALYRITINHSGLALTRFLLPARHLTWDEMEGIATGITQETLFGRVIFTRFQTTLYLASGKRLPLDGRLKNLPELTTRLKASLYRRAFSRLRTDFLDGYPVQFGPLTLQRKFIKIRQHVIPWEQVARLTIQSGSLVVELIQQAPLRIRSSQIPNLELLFRLVTEGVKL